MTPKFLAKRTLVIVKGYTYCIGVETVDGDKFEWFRDPPLNLTIGDKVWIASRLNVPKDGWCYEVYQVTIEVNKNMHSNYPKTWYGNGKRLLTKVSSKKRK